MEECSLQALPLAVVEDRATDVVRARKRRKQQRGAVQDVVGSTSRASMADRQAAAPPLVGSLSPMPRHQNAADDVAAVSVRGGPASTSQPEAGRPGSVRQCEQADMRAVEDRSAGTKGYSKGLPKKPRLSRPTRSHKEPLNGCQKQQQRQHAGKSEQTGTNWWAPHEPGHGRQTQQHGMPQHSRACCHPITPTLHDTAQTTQHAASEQQRQQQPPPPPLHEQAGQRSTGLPPWLVPRAVAVALNGQHPQRTSPPQHIYNDRLRGAREPSATPLSTLHNEIESFARRAMPTEAEAEAVQTAARHVSECALELWPHCQVVPFGSQSTSMALPGSDVDIAILGVGRPAANGAAGFSKAQRPGVQAELLKLLAVLRSRKLLTGKADVIKARVPIIKCYILTSPGSATGIATDISIGVANGAAAVPFILQRVDEFGPALRSLVLVLKALLKEAQLNERAVGGLGSYSLLNLVMAHLTLEGISAARPFDLGALLLSFLQRFGCDFDYERHAVSVRQGGIMSKLKAWRQRKNVHLLALEDPQQPGIDIGSGCFNILEVRRCLREARDRLQARQLDPLALAAQQQAAAWAAVQADGQDASVASPTSMAFPLLSALLDVALALDRNQDAARARMDMMVPLLNFRGKGGRKKLVVKTNKMRAAGTASGHQKVAKPARKAKKQFPDAKSAAGAQKKRKRNVDREGMQRKKSRAPQGKGKSCPKGSKSTPKGAAKKQRLHGRA